MRSWLRTLWIAWRVYHAQIDPCAKCPSCGARSGKIRWVSGLKWPDSKTGAVVHTCSVCAAAWGEKPVVESAAWDIKLDADNGGVEAPFLNNNFKQSATRSGRMVA